MVFSSYNPDSEEKSLPAIILLRVQDVTLWAYLDIGSDRNFISKDAIKKLTQKPSHHETRQIVALNGVRNISCPYSKLDFIPWTTRQVSR